MDPDDERLDALALELGEFLNGWRNEDVAKVCTACVAFALAAPVSVPVEIRRADLETMIEFMRKVFENAVKDNEGIL